MSIKLQSKYCTVVRIQKRGKKNREKILEDCERENKLGLEKWVGSRKPEYRPN